MYTAKKEPEVKTLDILKGIYEESELDELFKKLESNYLLENFEINDLLIKKYYDICGNIDLVLTLLNKTHYPSSTQQSYNSRYFWMTVISALKN
ncbi:hypothetical protein [Lacrimispora sp.]|uniref:hypothetical protein n=1 Tax=Lacrimispora sp. TaxID=2719234 RepID=UPI0039E6C098